MPTNDAAPPPFRRKVFYVHGFDPRGPKPYHQFFAEGTEQVSATWGRTITVSKRRKAWDHGVSWQLETQLSDGRRVETDYELLRWDDTVRDIWSSRSPTQLVGSAFRVLVAYQRLGMMRTLRKPAISTFLSIATPPILFGGFLVLGSGMLLSAFLIGQALASALGLPPLLLSLTGIALTAWLITLLWRRATSSTELWWLTRCLDYLHLAAHGRVDRSEDRAKALSGRVQEAAQSGAYDEILIAGHSLGALHAVRTLAKTLQDAEDALTTTRCVLVFLGQSIPLYTAYGQDQRFAEDLVSVVSTPHLKVIDVTSGSDTGSTCRLDLLHGTDPKEQAPRHIQERPPFHQSLTPETFRKVRRNPRAYHFQYLQPAERPVGFDYLELITRPQLITTSRPSA
ncbi:MAG: hypothetical protein AAGH41_06470 [Pseudomonadota bacterium]